MRYAILLLAFASVALSQGSTDIVISQIFGGGGNSGAPYRNDYIELFNRTKAAVNVDGWSVQYASSTGTTWQVTPISGTIQPGRYYLVQQAEGANTSVQGLPTPDATGTIAMSGSAGQVAVMRSTQAPGANGAGAADYVQYSGLSNTTAAIRRSNGCTDTDAFADFQVVEPRPRNSQVEPAVNCEAPVEPPLSTTISAIQGVGSRSPLENRRVSTRGVVTARKNNGVWIQSLASDADSDSLTSEGLWVYFAMSPPGSVDRGYIVEVTGSVSEYRPASDPTSPTLTELIDPVVTITGQGQPLPAPVLLNAVEDLERYEGMRVSVPELRTVSGTLGSVNDATVTATSTGVFYGVLPGQARPYRSPDLSETLPRLRIDSRAQGGAGLDASSGVTVRNIVGPLDYAFRTYTIVQDVGETLSASTSMIGTPVVTPEAREFTVASMNLQQFYDSQDDPGGDVVVTPAALQARVTRASRLIREYLQSPDIVGVQEAENETVLRSIATAAGDYDAYLIEGDDPSGIDVGLLTKRGRVVVQSRVQEGRGDLIPGTSDRIWDRPPLVAKLTVEGVPVTAIVVHLRSLIDAETASVMAKRRAQAQFLGRIVREHIAAGEQVLLLGDFNTYNFDSLMSEVRGNALLGLSDTIAPGENYSYVFDGETQSIDHILISDGLRSRLTRYTVARVNADFAEVTRNDASRVERLSDHDVPVAYFTLDPQSLRLGAAGVVNAATFLGGSVAPLELITIFGRDLGPASLVSFEQLGPSLAGTRVLFDGVPGDMIYTSSGQVSVIVPTQVASRSMTRIQVEYQGQTTNGVLLPVAPSSPGIFTLTRTGGGQGAILNQDYSVNDVSVPADRGSVVMIYGTGGGLLEPTAGDVPARLTQPVSVRIGGKTAEVRFAGQAPGLVPGVVQINAQVPADLPANTVVPVVVSIGDRVSQFSATLAVR